MNDNGDEILAGQADRVLAVASAIATEVQALNEALETFDARLTRSLSAAFLAGALTGYLLRTIQRMR